MPKDNIILDGIIKSTTVSGVGISLSYDQLAKLVNNNTTSSGASLTGQTLYLDIDLSNRINISDIRIYLSSSTASGTILGNMNLSYKNYEVDSYTNLTRNFNSEYFYVENLPDSFSPRYIRFYITNTTCELLEIKALNNDEIVSFGVEGNESDITLNNMLSGDVSHIDLYNSGDTVANAYITIDYTGEESDKYIKLYNGEQNKFYGLEDGFAIGSDNINTDYRWDLGTFPGDFTCVSGNTIKLYKTEPFVFDSNNVNSAITISGFSLTKTVTDSWKAGQTAGAIMHGKYYFEVKVDQLTSPTHMMIGIGNITYNIDTYPGNNSTSIAYYGYDGNGYYNNGAFGMGSAYTTNDVIGIAVDHTYGSIWFSKNGVWQNSGNPSTDTSPNYTNLAFIKSKTTPIRPAAALYHQNDKVTFRFDSAFFSYPIPTGFVSIGSLVTASGSYLTPIFNFPDQYSSSYLLTTTTVVSGTTIGDDLNVYGGTINVRSSNIEPVAVDEIYWGYKASTIYATVIYTYNLYTNIENAIWYNWSNPGYNNYYTTIGTAVCRKQGHVFVNTSISAPWDYVLQTVKVINTGKLLINNVSSLGNDYAFDGGLSYDGNGRLWAYCKSHTKFVLIDYSSGSLVVVWSYQSTFDYIKNFSPEINGGGVWYIDKSNKSLVHLDSSGNSLFSDTSMTDPGAVCSTGDGGCWVSDIVGYTVKRFIDDGSSLGIIQATHSMYYICNDGSDGFWGANNNQISHHDSSGVRRITFAVSAPTQIRAEKGYVAVYSASNDSIIIYNNNGNILKTMTTGYTTTGFFDIYHVEHDTHCKSDIQVLPATYDPVWGVSGTLAWQKVKASGYFLPKTKYHQVKFDLMTNNPSVTPIIHEILSPPAVKVEDIQPNSSQPLYIQTNFPNESFDTNETTRLKVWWGI
jgi:hypothetical protein